MRESLSATRARLLVTTSWAARKTCWRPSSRTAPRPRLARPGSMPTTVMGECFGAVTTIYSTPAARPRPLRLLRPSILPQVLIELPLVDAYPVLLVLVGLRVDEAVEGVLAQRLAHRPAA